MTTARMTRSQVAQLLGVTPKTLYTWEKEGRADPPERDWRGWRWYSAAQVEALRRLIGGVSGQAFQPTPSSTAENSASIPDSEPMPAFTISARNRLVGTVREIASDGVLAEVVLELGGGAEIVSVITRSSVERLGLKVGMRAVALIKATEVMLAREA
jgi:molybdopterin-binding protein